jgi:hypothetical protein
MFTIAHNLKLVPNRDGKNLDRSRASGDVSSSDQTCHAAASNVGLFKLGVVQ